MRIEQLNINEVEKVSEICQNCINEINSKDLTRKQVDLLLSEFSIAGIIKNIKKFKVYVVKNEKNEIIGTGTLANNQIKGIFVDAEYFGLGVGKAIITVLENSAKEQGFKKIRLTSSKYAKNFYLKLGYKKIQKINSSVGETTEFEKYI